MRIARVRYDGTNVYYHVCNRVGGTRKDRVFDDVAKEKLVSIAKNLTTFFSVDVISFAVLSNHYHAVLSTSGELPNREEAARRYEAYYGESRPTPMWELDEIYFKHAERMSRLRDMLFIGFEILGGDFRSFQMH